MASSENASGLSLAPRDQSEHLDLALDGRTEVGEHVHPVVLRECRRRGLRTPGKVNPLAL